MHISHLRRVEAPSLLELERPAWIVAIATWVIGDLVTTFVDLSLGAGETNPLADSLIGGIVP